MENTLEKYGDQVGFISLVSTMVVKLTISVACSELPYTLKAA